MPNEAEMRLHRCCFLGHRPEKLAESPEEVKKWLETQIDRAISDGFTTFITGCAMGADLWAAQIVIRKKAERAALRLIAAVPWPGFPARWSDAWRRQYDEALKGADLVVRICDHYHDGVFRQRNEWMADHSGRVIAFYNGESGGTGDTIEYARSRGIEVVVNETEKESRPKRERGAKEETPPETPFPENLLTDIGLEAVFGEDRYTALSGDRMKGLEHIIGTLPRKEKEMLVFRYREGRTFRECGERFGVTRQRAQQIVTKAVGKLRHPSRIAFIRDGFARAELALMIRCAEEMKSIIRAQKKRRPEMNEEDVVKLAFQGMLGVGHLVSSEEKARERLHEEMSALEGDADEPLTEKVSPQWFRLNLRAAKAKGLAEEDIARMLFLSAGRGTLPFTRENVYNFCVKLDGSDRMEAAARRVLDEKWLPSHSEGYRAAYRPAYRVLHSDFIKLRPGEEE